MPRLNEFPDVNLMLARGRIPRISAAKSRSTHASLPRPCHVSLHIPPPVAVLAHFPCAFCSALGGHLSLWCLAATGQAPRFVSALFPSPHWGGGSMWGMTTNSEFGAPGCKCIAVPRLLLIRYGQLANESYQFRVNADKYLTLEELSCRGRLKGKRALFGAQVH